MEHASAGIRGERLRNTPLGIKCDERKNKNKNKIKEYNKMIKSD